MSKFMPADWRCSRYLRATHVTGLNGSHALTYLEPEKPTVRSCDMRSAVLVTYIPAAPRNKSSAEAMMARKTRSMGVHRGWLLVASDSR